MSSSDAGVATAGDDGNTDLAEAIPAPQNVRAIARIGTDCFLRVIDTMARLAGDDLVLALVYNAMWTANVRHITTSAANTQYGDMDHIPPDDLRVPISVMALANSLRIPYETVRRCVLRMLDQGLCIRVGRNGYIVPSRVFALQAQRESFKEGLPTLLHFVGDLKKAGFDFQPYHRVLPQTVAIPPGGAMPPNARALLRVFLELVFRGIDTLGRIHGDDFLKSLIFSAIWAANVQHITNSADNRKFGNLRDLPPDEMRRPITVNALATSLRIPYETVRRAINRLVRDGEAVRVEGKGLIVPRARLAKADNYEGVRRTYIHIARTIADLHRAGFDFRGY